MKFVIEPLNEGQEMNARVYYKGDMRQALAKAYDMASEMNRLLTGCSITVMVRREANNGFQYADESWSRIVTLDGEVINVITGKLVKYIWRNDPEK